VCGGLGSDVLSVSLSTVAALSLRNGDARFFEEGRRLLLLLRRKEALQVVLSLSDRPFRPVNASYFFN